MSFPSWCSWLWLSCLTHLATSGCSTEEVAAIGESCFVNSDCSDPLVCVFQKCHIQCRTDPDCRRAVDDESLCQRGSQPVNVCQNEAERACTTDATCLPGQVCATDARCRDQCQSDLDCIELQVCAQGACANPDELEQGKLPELLEGDGTGSPCTYHSDCEAGLVCNEGTCRTECFADRDCRVDQCCTAQRRCALQQFRDAACRPLDDGAGGDAGLGGSDGSGT